MRRLEARFHFPFSALNRSVVVGHVVWDGECGGAARIEPAPSLRHTAAPVTLLKTLKHLVLVAGPDAFERLRNLRNTHWSFVEVAAPDTDTVADDANEAA
jgi:hypothetical protein